MQIGCWKNSGQWSVGICQNQDLQDSRIGRIVSSQRRDSEIPPTVDQL